MKRFISLGAALLLSAGMANADEPGQVYAGVSVGTNDIQVGCVTGNCNGRKPHLSGKAYVGYTPTDFQWANPDLRNAFELMGYWAEARDGGYLADIGGGYKISYRGIGVVDAMSYRIDAVTLTGRLGLGYTWAREDYGVYPTKREQLGVIAGGGVAYAVDKRWSVKADIDQVPGTSLSPNKKPLNLLTSGVGYRF